MISQDDLLNTVISGNFFYLLIFANNYLTLLEFGRQRFGNIQFVTNKVDTSGIVQQSKGTADSRTGTADNSDIFVFEEIGVTLHTVANPAAQKFFFSGNAQLIACCPCCHNQRFA